MVTSPAPSGPEDWHTCVYTSLSLSASSRYVHTQRLGSTRPWFPTFPNLNLVFYFRLISSGRRGVTYGSDPPWRNCKIATTGKVASSSPKKTGDYLLVSTSRRSQRNDVKTVQSSSSLSLSGDDDDGVIRPKDGKTTTPIARNILLRIINKQVKGTHKH